jgi:hypothetical protein
VGLGDAVRRRFLAAAERAGIVRPTARWTGVGLPPLPSGYGLPADSLIVAPGRHQAVFRLLGYRPEVRVRDFQSNFARGRPQGPGETYVDHLGISVFATEQLAVENAARWPKHLAAVLLPENEGFSIARTYPEIDGHYTVWGDPERLLANVERVTSRTEPGTLEAG